MIIIWSIIILFTVDSLYPNARGKLTVIEIKGYFSNLNVSIGSNRGFGIKIIPFIINHLPACYSSAVDEIICVAVDLYKTCGSLLITATCTYRLTVLH